MHITQVELVFLHMRILHPDGGSIWLVYGSIRSQFHEWYNELASQSDELRYGKFWI